MMVVSVGTAPSDARPPTIYPINCSAPASETQHCSFNHVTAEAVSALLWLMYPGRTFGTRLEISSRKSETKSQSSSVRCGASPRQNGTVGGWPCASSTKTRPVLSMRWMRQLVLPRRMMSPAEESMAKSSSSVAICTPSGCTMTANKRGVRNRAAIRHRDDPRTPPRMQMPVHAIAQQVRTIAAAGNFNSLRQKTE